MTTTTVTLITDNLATAEAFGKAAWPAFEGVAVKPNLTVYRSARDSSRAWPRRGTPKPTPVIIEVVGNSQDGGWTAYQVGVAGEPHEVIVIDAETGDDATYEPESWRDESALASRSLH